MDTTVTVPFGIGADATWPVRRLLVELVGPAGAGKTAVLRALSRRDPSVQPILPLPRLRTLLPTLLQGVALAPGGLELLRFHPGGWAVAARHLLRARTLSHMLVRRPGTTATTIVVDEGPIYSLCRVLLALGLEGTVTRSVPQVWSTSLARWGRALDLIIWVDASDDVLTERIRERVKAHPVKDLDNSDVHLFLRRFRAAYRVTVEQLSAATGLPVIALDSGRQTTEQIADAVLPAFARARQTRPPTAEREA